MSKANFVAFMKAIAGDQQLMGKVRTAKSFDDIRGLARERGLDLGDLSEAEARQAMRSVVSEGLGRQELSEADLEAVSGGGMWNPWEEPTTGVKPISPVIKPKL